MYTLDKIKYDDSWYKELWLLDREQDFIHGIMILISPMCGAVGGVKKVETTWLYRYTMDNVLLLN